MRTRIKLFMSGRITSGQGHIGVQAELTKLENKVNKFLSEVEELEVQDVKYLIKDNRIIASVLFTY